MFAGHYGVAMAAKKIAPKASLGTLVLAAQFIDLLWPPLLLAGVEKVRISPGVTTLTPLDFYFYPYSHSLMAVILWAALFGAALKFRGKGGVEAMVAAGLVVSHWILDLLVHRPDLPLAPGLDVFMGFGLWNNAPVEIVLELAIFFAGALIYWRAAGPFSRKGAFVFWGGAAFLLTIFVANIFTLPPSVEAIAWSGNLLWLFVVWGYWVERSKSAI